MKGITLLLGVIISLSSFAYDEDVVHKKRLRGINLDGIKIIEIVIPSKKEIEITIVAPNSNTLSQFMHAVDNSEFYSSPRLLTITPNYAPSHLKFGKPEIVKIIITVNSVDR